ncbi:MAG: TIGR03085 family metal-binding protein [Acidimicrobiales bacterium]
MAATSLDAIEREQLCDLFLQLGPEAPTLCDGWSTLDLAAHLVVRETDPRAGPAILGGDRFAELEQRLMDRARSRGLDALVERLRGGPPLVPWRIPGLRGLLNLNEWFVHHEDVRRANGQEPRVDVAVLEAELWASLGRARFMVRGLKDAGLELVAAGYGTRTVRNREPKATVQGGPQELVLFLSGRRDAAEVGVTGDDEAKAALAAARLGF